MTLMSTLPKSDHVSVAELATAAAAGDRAALAGIYNRYAAPLHAYCVGILRDRHSAYAYPRIVEFVDELPKTLTGKIRRIELRERGE